MNTINSNLENYKKDVDFVKDEQELCLERFTKFLLKCYELHNEEINIEYHKKVWTNRDD